MSHNTEIISMSDCSACMSNPPMGCSKHRIRDPKESPKDTGPAQAVELILIDRFAFGKRYDFKAAAEEIVKAVTPEKPGSNPSAEALVDTYRDASLISVDLLRSPGSTGREIRLAKLTEAEARAALLAAIPPAPIPPVIPMAREIEEGAMRALVADLYHAAKQGKVCDERREAIVKRHMRTAPPSIAGEAETADVSRVDLRVKVDGTEIEIAAWERIKASIRPTPKPATAPSAETGVWEVDSLADVVRKLDALAKTHAGLESGRALRLYSNQIANIAGSIKEWPEILKLRAQGDTPTAPGADRSIAGPRTNHLWWCAKANGLLTCGCGAEGEKGSAS